MNTACISLWWKAIRPTAYPTSILPLMIGGLTARHLDLPFSWLHLVLSTTAGLLLHTAANLWNDYFDFHSGVDIPGGAEGSGVLTSKLLTSAQIFRAACFCAAAATIIGLGLVLRVHSIWLLFLGIAGLIGAIVYAAGRHSPKHHALGEVHVFLLMGLGLPLGAFLAQNGTPSPAPLIAALPPAFLIPLLLYTNNLRDASADAKAGIRTLPHLVHEKVSPYLQRWGGEAAAAHAILWPVWLLLAGAYLPLLLPAFSPPIPRASSLALLTFPLAILWATRLLHHPADDNQMQNLCRLLAFYGLFYLPPFLV